MVQVHRLVERFDQKGSGKRDSQCFLDDEPAEKLGKTQIEERKFLADCEQDIRGIVKKVVKVRYLMELSNKCFVVDLIGKIFKKKTIFSKFDFRAFDILS